MDISTATTLASGLVALIAPALVQAFKTYIPSGYVGLVSLAVSILFGVIAIAATGGFDGTYTWGIVLAGVAVGSRYRGLARRAARRDARSRTFPADRNGRDPHRIGMSPRSDSRRTPADERPRHPTRRIQAASHARG